jgi:1,4-dihydroxy-2-naphthoate octaprenyltransferase
LGSVTLLAVNNLRDVESDRAAGKRTLAVRSGVRFARVEIASTALAPFALGGAWLFSGRPWAAVLPLAALPIAVPLVIAAARTPPSERFNRLLARSALLQLVFAALLAIALSIPGR